MYSGALGHQAEGLGRAIVRSNRAKPRDIVRLFVHFFVALNQRGAPNQCRYNRLNVGVVLIVHFQLVAFSQVIVRASRTSLPTFKVVEGAQRNNVTLVSYLEHDSTSM